MANPEINAPKRANKSHRIVPLNCKKSAPVKTIIPMNASIKEIILVKESFSFKYLIAIKAAKTGYKWFIIVALPIPIFTMVKNRKVIAIPPNKPLKTSNLPFLNSFGFVMKKSQEHHPCKYGVRRQVILRFFPDRRKTLINEFETQGQILLYCQGITFFR